MKLLILSDGRMGHLNQSIALAKYLNASYDIVNVGFKNRFFKGISYFLDKVGLYTDMLFTANANGKSYDYVIGAGSTTYYPVKVLSKQLKSKSVVMMYPKGYRPDFDFIFAQKHDNAPKQDNIIEIPANFSYIEPKGIYTPHKERSIGIVIGGDNKVFQISFDAIKIQLDQIKKLYQGYEIAITTSPRTSHEIESLVESYGFDYQVIFSKNPVNPIPDFLKACETVFITGDSTSMISEAISYGESNVAVLPLKSKSDNKFVRFIETLAKEGYLHIFDGTFTPINKKIDFAAYLPKEMR